MAYIIGPKKEQSIYLIKDPLRDCVYIDSAKKDQLKEAYRRHRYGRRALTRKLFDDAKENGIMPKLYLLEDLEATEREAYNHVLAWARRCYDVDFEIICGGKFSDQMMDLNAESMSVYKRIEELEPRSLLVSDNELFGDYGTKKFHRDKGNPEGVTVRVSDDEYAYISGKAQELNMSMSDMCRELVMKGYIQHVDAEVFDVLYESVEKFRVRNNILQQILLTIHATQRYNPMDLKIIQEQIDENARQQQVTMMQVNEMLQTLREDIREHIAD